jgi:polar amino acid transport system substrate-binding protein
MATHSLPQMRIRGTQIWSVLAWACHLALACCVLLAAVSALSQTSTAPVKPFIWASDGGSTTYGSRWVTLIYTEAFKRLGMPMQMEYYTLARREALVEEGIVDGETSRVYSYGDSRPYLVRVEESLIDLSFALFAANPSLQLKRLEDLQSNKYLVEYRRGMLLCEKTLKGVVPPEWISDVPTQGQGLQKLIAGRTDLYCDLEVYVLQELQLPEFKGANVRKVISIGNAVPTYPYLNKQHADLAPRLAAVLKQMKAEGLIEAYRQQVERDLGWIK